MPWPQGLKRPSAQELFPSATRLSDPYASSPFTSPHRHEKTSALLVLLGASTLLDADAGRVPLVAVPAIYLTGGCAGVLVVATSNYAAAQTGVTLLSMLLLAFQVLSSAAIDHYGWLGTAPQSDDAATRHRPFPADDRRPRRASRCRTAR